MQHTPQKSKLLLKKKLITPGRCRYLAELISSAFPVLQKQSQKKILKNINQYLLNTHSLPEAVFSVPLHWFSWCQKHNPHFYKKFETTLKQEVVFHQIAISTEPRGEISFHLDIPLQNIFIQKTLPTAYLDSFPSLKNKTKNKGSQRPPILVFRSARTGDVITQKLKLWEYSFLESLEKKSATALPHQWQSFIKHHHVLAKKISPDILIHFLKNGIESGFLRGSFHEK